MKPAVERMGHPGWCVNLVQAAALQPGESVLVVVDEPLLEQGSQLVATVADAGGRPRLEVWSGDRPMEHAPTAVLDAADRADVCYFVHQDALAAEAGARFELMQRLTGHGGREIFMGFVDAELLAGELSRPAPDLVEPAERLLDEVSGADRMHLTSPGGTDLTLRVGGRPWRDDVHALQPGTMANFPGGEIYVAPHRDGADGVLVADLTVPYTVDGLVDEPVVIRFERGRITAIEGGRAADMLRTIVEEAGPGGDVVAELGIGLNHTIVPRGHVLLDEKAGGTAHVAIGRNTGHYGGDNEASIHIDCIFASPRITADGRLVTP
ncbi:MAG TPA: aminopeptidase [Gaiellaceae bacterium]|nr:aminopeptidase [Gaiellaceae bacterium]